MSERKDTTTEMDFFYGFMLATGFAAVAFLLLNVGQDGALHRKDVELRNLENHYEQLLEATRNAKSSPTPPPNTTFWKYTDESGQVFYTNKKTGDAAAEQVLILHPSKN